MVRPANKTSKSKSSTMKYDTPKKGGMAKAVTKMGKEEGVLITQYPSHLIKGIGQGVVSVGKGFMDGVGDVVTGVKRGAGSLKYGVVKGGKNLTQFRLIRGPLRMVDGIGMGAANIATGTVRGVKTVSHGAILGGRTMVRGVTGLPLPQSASKKMSKPVAKAVKSAKKLTSTPKKASKK